MGFGNSKRRKHSKPGKTTLRAFHFRLEINDKEFSKLHSILDAACELKNNLVVMLENSRKEAKAAKLKGDEYHHLSAFELKQQVASKLLEPKFLALHSQVRQDLSMRVIEGQQRWFEALKEGRRHVHPPSVMRRKDFRSITFTQYGTAAHIKNGKLHLSRIGDFRVIGWRKMRGSKKSVTIKFKEGHFWAIVMCEIQERDVCRPFHTLSDLPESGFDPGLTSVLTDSLGKSYDTPKPLKAAQAKLHHIQKDVSRKFEVRKALHLKHLAKVRVQTGSKAPVAEGLTESLRLIPYSNRLKANIKKLAKAHTKVERIRADVTRKNARKTEKKFKRVAVEEHGLMFMMRNRRLAKACSDVAIGKQKLALKSALGKGRYVQAANRRVEGGNSQTCLCGASVPKTLKDRYHNCPECGLQGPRDQISAIIVQHTAFGSVPKLSAFNKVGYNKELCKESVPGLGILERAVKTLETRRGESKASGGESRPSESKSAVITVRTLEPSKKRLTQKRRKAGNTAGEIQTANAEVNTMGHAGLTRTCLIETKEPAQMPLRAGVSLMKASDFALKRFSILEVDVIGIRTEKHPPSGG